MTVGGHDCCRGGENATTTSTCSTRTCIVSAVRRRRRDNSTSTSSTSCTTSTCSPRQCPSRTHRCRPTRTLLSPTSRAGGRPPPHRCRTLRVAVLFAPLFLQLLRRSSDAIAGGPHGLAWTPFMSASKLCRCCCLAFQFPVQARRPSSRPPKHAYTRRLDVGSGQQRLGYKADADDVDDHGDDVDDESIIDNKGCDSLTPATQFDRLGQNTQDILDLEFMPLGELRQEEIASITNLMVTWAKTKNRTGALMVERLLKRIVDDINVGNTDVKVTTRLYTVCIDAWAKVGGIEAADRAQQIHDALVAKHLKSGDELLAPSTISFNALLNAWSKSKSSNSPNRAEKIISEMMERGVKPDVVSFTAAIDCYAKSHHSSAGNEGLRLFRTMEDLGLQPNVFVYSALANAIAKSADGDAPQKAEALLEEMKQKSREGNWKLLPTTVLYVYNSVINAHVRKNCPQKANEILDQMIEDGVEPDSLSWKLVVKAWASSDDEGALRNGEEMLLRSEKWALCKMKEIERTSALPRHKVTLDRDAYNAVLSSFARAQECDDAAQRALAILRRMVDLADAGVKGVRPNICSWNSVLKTMSQTREPSIATKAEAVIGYMIKEGGVMPDQNSFKAVLNTMQRNPTPGSAARADYIVRQMQRLFLRGDIKDPPDVYIYTILLTCWSKSGELVAAHRCRQILNYMLQQWRAGNESVKPNTRAYNAVIESHARNKDFEQAEELLDLLISASTKDASLSPDAFSFRSVIAAWTRSRRRDAGTRAVHVLELYLSVLPQSVDSKPFSLIIEWFSRRRDLPDAARQAEALLDRMIALYEQNGYHQMVPSLYTFINVINAHANSRQHAVDIGSAAERVQSTMLAFSRRNNLSRLRRNVIVSNAVISALATSGEVDAAERAESILNDLLEGPVESDNVEPNTDSYHGVILAWAKSNSPMKTRRAKNILDRMKNDFLKGNRNCRPTAQAYTAVINAAAFSNGNRDDLAEAFQIATNTLNELYTCPYCDGPNSATMGTFIKACGRLEVSTDVLLEKLEMALQKTIALGLVDSYVLDQFFYACPVSTGLYRKLLGELVPVDGPEKVKVDAHLIPKEWRRNVREAEVKQWPRRTRVSKSKQIR